MSRLLAGCDFRPERVMGLNRVRYCCVILTVIAAALICNVAAFAGDNSSDARLKRAYRFERDNWVFVHLEGGPADVGYQHGYLLTQEIKGALDAMKLPTLHETKRDWNFYRTTSKDVLWPHIEEEYRQELQGIADGAKAHGLDVDVWDVVTLNSTEEVPAYYVPWLDEKEHTANAPSLHSPGNCSALVA